MLILLGTIDLQYFMLTILWIKDIYQNVKMKQNALFYMKKLYFNIDNSYRWTHVFDLMQL
jgi:hypothetical protein